MAECVETFLAVQICGRILFRALGPDDEESGLAARSTLPSCRRFFTCSDDKVSPFVESSRCCQTRPSWLTPAARRWRRSRLRLFLLIVITHLSCKGRHALIRGCRAKMSSSLATGGKTQRESKTFSSSFVILGS